MFKKNKNERTFKYIDDEATVLYRALDKDGKVVCESMDLEDILEECESLKGITYEKQEVFTVTDGFQPFKPKKNKKPSPFSMLYGGGRVNIRRTGGYIRRDR